MEIDFNIVSKLASELYQIGLVDGYLSTNPCVGFDERCRNIRAREIGKKLDEMGGFDLMTSVHSKIQEMDGSARQLESCWGEIGEWLP